MWFLSISSISDEPRSFLKKRIHNSPHTIHDLKCVRIYFLHDKNYRNQLRQEHDWLTHIWRFIRENDETTSSLIKDTIELFVKNHLGKPIEAVIRVDASTLRVYRSFKRAAHLFSTTC